MSQELVPVEKDSGFTSQGFASFPNCYEDNKRIGAVSEWEDAAIQHKFKEYDSFAKRTDLMPRARETANRIGRHLVFEKMWRAGLFEKAPDDPGELA